MSGGKGGGQTVGYKYYLGMHQILCHGPVDKVLRFRVDERDAWVGEATGGPIEVNAPSLFGGDKREGGVSGTIDIEMGAEDQTPNDYLMEKVSPEVPAHRGVLGVVMRQCYLGNNPYLKPTSWQVQRIHTRQAEGLAQWYDAKAAINSGVISGASTDIEFVGQQQTTRFSTANNSTNFALTGGIASTPVEGDLVIIAVSSGRYPFNTNPFHNVISGYTPLTGLYSAQSILADFQWRAYYKFMGPTPDTSFLPIAAEDTSSRNAIQVMVFRGVDEADLLASTVETVSGVGPSSYDPPDIDVSGVIFDPGDIGGTSGENHYIFVSFALQSATAAQALPVVLGGQCIGGGGDEGTGNMLVIYQHETASSSGTRSARVYALYGDPVTLGTGADMNPAHIIRECLTDPDWGMGYDEADIDDDSFTAAADQLFAEAFGITILWDRQKSIDSFVSEILKHIDAALYVSRTTGKFVLKLIRSDYDPEALLELDESSISRITDPAMISLPELPNSVTVIYVDGTTGKEASLTAIDTALVQMQGTVINTTLQYPGITNSTVAAMVAQRDLRALSAPLLSCTVHADNSARVLNIGDVFGLSWAKWGLASKVMRVTGLQIGDGRTRQVRINCVEDVFDTSTTVIISGPDEAEWEDPSQPPGAVAVQLAIEAPYYELTQMLGQTDIDTRLASNPELGFVMAAAPRPGTAINATLWTDSGAGYTSAGPLDFCPAAVLEASLDKTTETLTFAVPLDVDDIPIGSHIQIDDEIMRVDSVDEVLGEMTVGRGCLDTVPAEHEAGAWLLAWDTLYGIDSQEYVSGETIDTKVLPATGAGELDIGEATEYSVTLAQRAYRPYPPGNLLIEGESYLEDQAVSGTVNIAWAHRDRLQQTGGTLYDHTDGDIGPEAGTTYRIRGYIEGVLDDEQDGVSGTSGTWDPAGEGLAEVFVHSKRDSIYSLQAPSHEFIYTWTASRQTESNELRYTEEGAVRLTED